MINDYFKLFIDALGLTTSFVLQFLNGLFKLLIVVVAAALPIFLVIIILVAILNFVIVLVEKLKTSD
jgi:hypothetical protein